MKCHEYFKMEGTPVQSMSSPAFSDLGYDGQGTPRMADVKLRFVTFIKEGVDVDDPDEGYDFGTEANGRDSLKLKLDGSKYTEWRVMIVGKLEANPDALAVVQGKLTPT